MEHSQLILIEGLELLLERNHPKERLLLPRIIAVVTNLRTLTRLYSDQEEKIGTEWSHDLKFPPLFYEIFSH